MLPNPKTEALDVVKPFLIEEWQSDIYGGISTIFPSSSAKVNWTCRRCHGEFEETIDKQVSAEFSCPYCSGKKVLKGFNSLDITNPELINEWSETNVLKVNQSVSNINKNGRLALSYMLRDQPDSSKR